MTGIKGYVAIFGEAFKNLRRDNATIDYVTDLIDPSTAVPVPKDYGGLHHFRGAPEVNPDLCTVCGICAKECPTHCITITGPIEDPNTPEGKEAYHYSIKMAQCMFCQTCEEFCPVGKKGEPAVKLTDRWALAHFDPETTIETKVVYKKARKKKE